jgi:hypothetical protein
MGAARGCERTASHTNLEGNESRYATDLKEREQGALPKGVATICKLVGTAIEAAHEGALPLRRPSFESTGV